MGLRVAGPNHCQPRATDGLKRGTPNPLDRLTYRAAPLSARTFFSSQTRRALVASRGPQFHLLPIAIGTA